MIVLKIFGGSICPNRRAEPMPQGHPESMHNLGVKLYFGEGMDSDRRRHPEEPGGIPAYPWSKKVR